MMLTRAEIILAIEAQVARAVDVGDPDALVEAELLRALLTGWADAYAEAVSVGFFGDVLPDGELTDDDVGTVLARFGLVLGTGLVSRVGARLFAVLRRGYASAASAVLREAATPATSPATWTLGGPDERALAWLQEDAAWYVRSHVDRVTAERIRAVGQEALAAGMNRTDAGRLFASRLTETYGEGQRYWTLLAAAVTTRSREWGRIAGYVAAGVETVYVSAVRDRRTSDVCRFLHGRQIAVSDIVAKRDELLALAPGDPAAIRQVAPWRPVEQVRALVSANGGVIPASVGLPPYHGHCRTRTVVKPPPVL